MAIEIVMFRLAEGVSEKVFLEADYRYQTEFIPFQPGFMRRTTGRGREGEWVVISLWGSEAHADAAARLARDDKVAKEFWSLVDDASLVRKFYSTLD
jgi:hypothetical protein